MALLKIYDPRVNSITIKKDLKLKIDESQKNIEILNNIEISNQTNIEEEFDCLVVLTDWDEFKSLKLKTKLIFDGVRLLKNSIYKIGS